METNQNLFEHEQFSKLTSDLGRCEEHLDSADCQFWRRAYIRTAFSIFEAMNNFLKEKAAQAASSGDKTAFNTTRIDLLADYTYHIERNGKIVPQEQRFPFLNYTAFVLRSLCEESYVKANFFSDNGWNEFQKAVQIRHRLTHPKMGADLDVSDTEIQSIKEAMHWYGNAVVHGFSNREFWTEPQNFQSNAAADDRTATPYES
jgi:hypothetical protein